VVSSDTTTFLGAAMQTFQIPATDSVDASQCNTCCCTTVRVPAGATDKWTLLYAAWSTPIGGQGITANVSFDIQLKTAPLVGQTNNPPVPNLLLAVTPHQTALVSALTATDAESNPLTYAVMPLHGPTNGSVVVNADGTFTYTPNPMFTGYDRFFFTVSDTFHNPVVGEAIIGVSPVGGPAIAAPTASMATPHVTVRPKNVKVNSPWQSLTFPLEVSPQAKVGDVYRFLIRAQSVDCDCVPYYRTDCVDVIISACK
jgi:Bacterial Ig domain